MSAPDLTRLEPEEPGIDYPRVGLISAGHLMNDLYGNLMASLTPYLVLRGVISTTLAGFLVLVYLFGSSVLQPLFGLMSDRTGRRIYVILGPIWIGTAASLFGWAPNGLVLLFLAAVGGIGTAAFHPQAASMVNLVSGKNKGWTMAIFSMGGNLGFALGPLVAATIATVGLHLSPVILLPGIILTGLLARFTPHIAASGQKFDLRALREATAGAWRSLVLIVAVIATRSGTQFVLILFLPLYYHARGFPAQLGSYYAFVLSVSGALGGLLGGRLSDRYGRKVVVVSTLAVSAPLLCVALLSTGWFVWPVLVIAGATLLASNSVTVVQGQERLPGSTGIASGLTMGLAFGLSGVISSTFTMVSGHIGITSTVMVVPLLALIAAGCAALVPEVHAAARPSQPGDSTGHGAGCAAE